VLLAYYWYVQICLHLAREAVQRILAEVGLLVEMVPLEVLAPVMVQPLQQIFSLAVVLEALLGLGLTVHSEDFQIAFGRALQAEVEVEVELCFSDFQFHSLEAKCSV
jgi:hypothetical protein